MAAKKLESRQKRKIRIRAKIRSGKNRLRLSVFRSNKHFYGQIIDDEQGKTLASVVFQELKEGDGKKLTKLAKAKLLGGKIAEKAKSRKIKKVVFDRGGYKYHGRVKAFAQGAREGGLDF